ncbi:twin-arginine translocase TatA/TatE family subunit [Rothia sp. AR01]|uniref:Twin-arginine translocase TatA/TatE family subunit n=1 Tax=Rothia santali TaxID=2949643 RepID=A0A9X2KIQ9_9MICC|nr:twin-arginine translocase TatA/TatE family subunit [Rothia santali]MCP3426084.1 twin-arginine translocase TatA/TatE family subunit [Rothia santali]
MFGINGAEFLVLAVIVFFVIGPERMPEYARQLKDLIKGLRRTAVDAKDGIKESLGPELSEINWRAYDPRQYDPRRIVREALMEDDEETAAERERAAAPPRQNLRRLTPGQPAPFDTEAT